MDLCRENEIALEVCPISCVQFPNRTTTASSNSAVMSQKRDLGMSLIALLTDTNTKSDPFQRLTSSMPMHPLPIMLNRGLPVTLNSDDPSVFGSMGLSYDYFQVLVSSETTGLITLAQIARDSIQVR
jgi:adenosine deaminase